MREAPGASARATPGMACARQSQVPSRSGSEFLPPCSSWGGGQQSAHGTGTACSRLHRRGVGTREALKDMGRELRGFAEGRSC